MANFNELGRVVRKFRIVGASCSEIPNSLGESFDKFEQLKMRKCKR